jgi:hypothetical protein
MHEEEASERTNERMDGLDWMMMLRWMVGYV